AAAGRAQDRQRIGVFPSVAHAALSGATEPLLAGGREAEGFPTSGHDYSWTLEGGSARCSGSQSMTRRTPAPRPGRERGRPDRGGATSPPCSDLQLLAAAALLS